MPRRRRILKKLLIASLAIIAPTLTNCASSVPAVDYCIHSSQFKKFYCTNSKSGDRKELTYSQANKYISVSPRDYQKIIDFISEVTEEAGLKVNGELFYAK